MPKIVLSYRRSDSDAIAGRIRDRLVREYGEDSVFMDIDSIPFGTDFRAHIEDAIRRNDVLLAVVGPNWIGFKPDGSARITEELDFVRIEVETALRSGIPVIPLLVDGAAMPKPEELPDSIKDFPFRNAAEINTGRDFHQHVDRLVRSLDQLSNPSPQDQPRQPVTVFLTRRIGYLAAALLLALGAGYAGYVLRQRGGAPLTTIAVPDPRSIGTTEDLARALQEIEAKKARLSRDEIHAISEELTARILPSDENVMPRDTRRDMNEKLVATLLRLNDKDLSYVWRQLPSDLDLAEVDFSGVNLRGVKFQRTFAIYTRFRQALLDDAVFDDVRIRNSDFTGASLSEAVFARTDWFNAFGFSPDRKDGQPMAFAKWLFCPDGYQVDREQPFVKQLEQRYPVKFINLRREDVQKLTSHWSVYAAGHELCDIVQGRP